MNWIDVKNRLPEYGVRVLVPNRGCVIAYRYEHQKGEQYQSEASEGQGWYWADDYDGHFKPSDVQFWMPLPLFKEE